MRKLNPLVLAMLLPLSAGPALAAAGEKGSWIHVEVDEHKADGAKVSLNLPLAALDVALGLVNGEGIEHGRVRLDHKDVKVAELRQMWKALKAAGDTDLVRAEEGGDSVQIRQKNGRVTIEVREHKGSKSQVNVDLPASAVDELLSGEGESLDLRGALAALARESTGDVVRVEDGDTHVRIWIE